MKLKESHQFMDIGSWWERKRGKEANEIDIVAIYVDYDGVGKKALAAEVKRQKRNYDHKDFMAKVDHLKDTILTKYEIATRLFTIEDM